MAKKQYTPITDEIRDRVLALHAQGMSQTDIAKTVGIGLTSAHRFIEWREMGQRPQGSRVEWPRGFDCETGEWVRMALTVGSEQAFRSALSEGRGEVIDLLESMPREERRTPADWVRGMLFDYPVWPDGDTRSDPVG